MNSSINRIDSSYSRTHDIAELFGDYTRLMDHRDDSATAAQTPVLPTFWRNVIDKPSRGVRAYIALTTARTPANLRLNKAYPQRPDMEDQGNLPSWNRMHHPEYAALDPIAGNNEAERLMRGDRVYGRHVVDASFSDQKQARVEAVTQFSDQVRSELSLATRIAQRYRANVMRFCREASLSLSPATPLMMA